MAEIEIYSTAICPYCTAARNLLDARGLVWREVRIDTDPEARRLMQERTGGVRSVPQIFINGIWVGGFEQLAAAERSGMLNEWLGDRKSSPDPR